MAGFEEIKGNPFVIEWQKYCNGDDSQHDEDDDDSDDGWRQQRGMMMITLSSVLCDTITVKFCEDPTAWS